MKEELNKTIDELNEVIKEKGLQILDKDLLDFALKLYITDSINKQKQFTTPKYIPKNEFRNDFKKEESKTNPLTSKEEQPTEAQIKACKKLNIIIPAGANKKEVWRIMKENKENNEKQN